MAVLKYKNKDGEYVDIPTLVGPPGPAGAKYTAGTNIEITDDDVINNTIPYVKNDKTLIALATGNYQIDEHETGVVIGNAVLLYPGDFGNAPERNVAIGTEVKIRTADNVVIGAYAESTNRLGWGNNVVIGNNSKASQGHGVAIGSNAEAGYFGIAIGSHAKTTKDRQMMIGGRPEMNEYIEEVALSTSNGVKTLATTEDIANAIGDLDTILTALDTGEGVE